MSNWYLSYKEAEEAAELGLQRLSGLIEFYQAHNEPELAKFYEKEFDQLYCCF